MDAIIKMLRFLEVLSKDNIYYSALIQIIKNVSRVPDMTIYELSDATFVSTSTLSRLAKLLGYQNFQDFKLDIAAALGYSRPIREDLIDTTAAQTKNALPINASHYLKSISERFDEMRTTLDSSKLTEAAAALRNAKNVGLFFQELYYAMELQRSLFIDGKSALLVKTLADEMEYAEKLEAGDVVLIAVHSPSEFGHKAPILKCAREHGAKIIMIYSSIDIPHDIPHDDIVDYIFAFQGTDSLTDNFFFGVYLKIITMAYQNII